MFREEDEEKIMKINKMHKNITRKTIKNQTDMKKYNRLILSLLAGLLIFSACDNIPSPDYWAQQRTVLFFEDFGDEAPSVAPFPNVREYTGFRTIGVGADSVRFLTQGGTVSVRSNSPSSGYARASGHANAMFAATGGASLLINNIATCGARNLMLSFGTNQTASDLSVAYQIAGSEQWHTINFQKTTEEWGWVADLEFILPEGTNVFNLRFTAGATQFGVRIDDIRITTQDQVGEPIYDTEPPAPPIEMHLLFFEDFGVSAPSGAPFPNVTDYTGFRTSGAGASEVFYSSEGGIVSVRSNSQSNFPDASGGSNVMLASTGASFLINDIGACGAENLILSFGSNQTDDILTVAYQIEGSSQWNVIDYEKDTSNWGLVEGLEITLPEGTNTFSLRFTAGPTQFGTRMDDIRIVTQDNIGDCGNGNGGNNYILNETLLTQESFDRFLIRSNFGAQVWTFDSRFGAVMSGFVGGVTHANEVSFISPAMDLRGKSNVVLTFEHSRGPASQMHVSTDNLTLWISSNFYVSGGQSDWRFLEIPNHGTTAWNFVSSGEIVFPADMMTENVRFRFRYICNDVESATWQIRNVVVR